MTALTVGYGDKVPITYAGKMVSIAWMFTATYCVGMFGAAVTGASYPFLQLYDQYLSMLLHSLNVLNIFNV